MSKRSVFVTVILFAIAQSIENINIVFIWFDDLGFGDTGYNGAEYPTPILDQLANNDAIKINFHYTEQVCSASRSSLLTGRYAWLTGLNSISNQFTNSGFDESLTLFPQLLNDNNWNTYIAGKWHVGYCNESLLPFNRGFETGLYTHTGLPYYSRQALPRSIATLDAMFGQPGQEIRSLRRQYLGRTYQVRSHDTYRINNYIETPAFIQDGLSSSSSYNEDLFTEDIKSYIADLNGSDPFFVYYSQWTPHSAITQPPETRPNGSIVDYSVCYDAFPDRSIPECDLDEDTRCVFCKQVHYASINIEEIIESIKANNNLNWDETVVIITSDNGAAPQTFGSNAYSFGSALPYRGRKSGAHEGGIRTPAIIKGGFVEDILGNNDHLTNNVCEYNDTVHVSDWYHIIINGLTQITSGYNPDSDHSGGMNIWQNIVCKCRGRRSPQRCDNRFAPRDEIISMRMCGDPYGDFDAGEKFFYSAYVRKGDWKLVVNSSHGVTQTCDSIEDAENLFNYIEADGTFYSSPNEDYWNNSYLPRFSRIDSSLAKTLYYSKCLVNYSNNTPEIVWNSPFNPHFVYDEQLLYEIPNDRIEACAIQNNEAKKNELLNILITRSEEYSVQQDSYDSILGSFRAQMQSFDCNVTFTQPWNGVNGGNVQTIWRDFLDKYIECYGSFDPTLEPTVEPTMEPTMEPTLEPTLDPTPTGDKQLEAAIVAMGFDGTILIIPIMLLSVTIIWFNKKCRDGGKQVSIEVESDASDIEDNVTEDEL